MTPVMDGAGGSITPAGEVPVALGRFRIEGSLGTGVHTRLYRATDERLGRRVVLRTVPRTVGEDGRARFARRISRWADCADPGLPTVFDLDEVDGHLVASLSWHRGRDLADLLRSGPLDAEQTGAVVRALSTIVSRLQARGVAHGALAPSHVLLAGSGGPGGDARVMVFGPAAGPLGTPADPEDWCVAPELIGGRAATAAGDVFSLAAIAYACAAGRPLHGLRPDGYGRFVPNRFEYWSSDLVGLPAAATAAILRALESDPAVRAEDPVEFAAAFRTEATPAANGSPAVTASATPRRRRGTGSLRRRLGVAAALAVAAVLGIATFGSLGSTPADAQPPRAKVVPASHRARTSEAARSVAAIAGMSGGRCTGQAGGARQCRRDGTVTTFAVGGKLPRQRATDPACVELPERTRSWATEAGGPEYGVVRCTVSDGVATLEWTDTRVGVRATAVREDGDSSALWQQWLDSAALHQGSAS